MFQNNNKAVVGKISYRYLRASKLRNIFAIVAIALTTVLFTSLFTIGISMIKSIEYSTMRQVGTSGHGGFKALTEKQFEVISKHKDIKQYGVRILVAMAQNSQLTKRQTEIVYLDKNDARYSFITPLLKGRMPNTENEVVLDTIVLDMLGLKYDLGQRVTFSYSINGKKYSKEFVLSGYYKGDKVSMASSVCVSKEFIEKDLAEVDRRVSKETGTDSGLINLDVMLDNKYDIEKKLIKILTDSGFSKKDIDIGVNWAYIGTNMFTQPDEFIPIVGLMLLIMLSGYLIIYNIFYISVVKDIRFFGLLKAIGTTSKQLKRLITRQATALSVIGVPIGLIIGYLFGRLLVPLVVKASTASHISISISPVIFIGAAFFSLVTVFISCRKPARMAAGISPIEAVRYTGIGQTGKRKVKRSKGGAKLHRMALSNLSRNKKKAIVVIASISLGIILFSCIYTIVIGFDINKYLKSMTGSDFTLADESFYRSRFNSGSSNALTQSLCSEISQREGVRSVDRIFNSFIEIPLSQKAEELVKKNIDSMDEMQRNDLKNSLLKYKTATIDLYGIDEGLYEFYSKYVIEGKFDKVLYGTGNYTIIRHNEYIGDIYNVGDVINLKAEDGTTRAYTVMAIVDELPMYLYNGGVLLGGFAMYVPSAEFSKLLSKPSIMTALVNVENGSISSMEQYIMSKIKQLPTLDYRSKAAYIKEFNDLMNIFATIGYTLSFIIAMIGLLNFANTIITGILTRKHEFATMQSIGMTAGQLRRMLASEGLYYTMFTFVVVLLVGMPIVSFGIDTLTHEIPFFTYHFSMFPVLLIMPVLAVISILIPVICFSKTNKASMTERLREIE